MNYTYSQTIVNYIGIYLEYTLIYGPIITPTTSHHQFVVIRNVMSANPIKAVKRATVPVYNTHICGLYTKKIFLLAIRIMMM